MSVEILVAGHLGQVAVVLRLNVVCVFCVLVLDVANPEGNEQNYGWSARCKSPIVTNTYWRGRSHSSCRHTVSECKAEETELNT